MGDLNARIGQDDERVVKKRLGGELEETMFPCLYNRFSKDKMVNAAHLKLFYFSIHRGLVILNGQKGIDGDFAFFAIRGLVYYIIEAGYFNLAEKVSVEEYMCLGDTPFPSFS